MRTRTADVHISPLKSHGGRHRDKGNRNVLYTRIIYIGYYAQRSIGRGRGRRRRRLCVRIPSLCGCVCLRVDGWVCGVCGTILRIRDFDGTTAGRPACDVCQGNGRTPHHAPRLLADQPPREVQLKNRWNSNVRLLLILLYGFAAGTRVVGGSGDYNSPVVIRNNSCRDKCNVIEQRLVPAPT